LKLENWWVFDQIGGYLLLAVTTIGPEILNKVITNFELVLLKKTMFIHKGPLAINVIAIQERET